MSFYSDLHWRCDFPAFRFRNLRPQPLWIKFSVQRAICLSNVCVSFFVYSFDLRSPLSSWAHHLGDYLYAGVLSFIAVLLHLPVSRYYCIKLCWVGALRSYCLFCNIFCSWCPNSFKFCKAVRTGHIWQISMMHFATLIWITLTSFFCGIKITVLTDWCLCFAIFLLYCGRILEEPLIKLYSG